MELMRNLGALATFGLAYWLGRRRTVMERGRSTHDLLHHFEMLYNI
jgi:hypothetical protein